jgi:membrane protease YdiL (CAAX protease family)
VASVLVVPLLAEPVVYLGVVLPRFEQRLGRPWLAALIVVALWAAEHALYPLLTSSGGGLDLGFAAYRWGRCCRTWPPGPPCTTPWLLPIMVAGWVFNGGTTLALALGLVG